MAVAGDPASHFGIGEAEIRTSKPVTMLPAFPRFLVAGDRASFGAVVTNNTTTGGDAVVTMRSLDGGALQFDGTLSRTVRLAPGESAPVRFDAVARAGGNARLQMTIALGGNTDAFELPIPVVVPSTLETVAAYGDTMSSVTEKLSIPAGILPRGGGLTVSLASTALVGLDGSARYLDEYSFRCGEQVASRALALLLSADLGGAFGLAGVKPAEQRDTALGLLNDLYSYQCGDGGFSFWPGECRSTSAYLTAYILSVFRTASTLKATLDRNAVDRALNYLQNHLREAPPEVQWRPAWSASQTFAVKVLAEFGRNVTADISRLYGQAESMPTFALSYLADAMAASKDRGPRYADVIRRISNKLALDADRAHVEEVDDVSLAWLWNTNVRATAVVLSGIARRGDDQTFVAPLARWLLAARQHGRWGTTQENAVALEALVSYYRAFEAEVPQLQAQVALAGRSIGNATFAGRSTTAQEFRIAMPDLVQQVSAAATRDLVVSRQGTGRLFYTARMQYLRPGVARCGGSRHASRAPLRAVQSRRRGRSGDVLHQRRHRPRDRQRDAPARGPVPRDHRSRRRGLRADRRHAEDDGDGSRPGVDGPGQRPRLARVDAARRVRSRREARRSRDRVRDPALGRPPRVQLPRARDDGRVVRRRRRERRGDVRAGNRRSRARRTSRDKREVERDVRGAPLRSGDFMRSKGFT